MSGWVACRVGLKQCAPNAICEYPRCACTRGEFPKEKPAVPFPPFSSEPPVNTYSESYPATEEIIEWLMKRWDETREQFYLFAAARLTSTSFAARKQTCKHGREMRSGCSSCLQERQS